MNRLVCNVIKCNNNSFGMCYKDKINVEGNKVDTRCCSFEKGGIFKRKNKNTLNQYLEKLQEVLDDKKTPEISCNVKKCVYNYNNSCTSSNVIIYKIRKSKEMFISCKSCKIQV